MQELEIVAAGPENPAQMLYFTGPSITADSAQLAFIRTTAGDPNIHVLDLATGAERRLSDNRSGTLKSYVYFRGTPYRGLSRASVSLDPRRKRVFYIQDRAVMAADLEGRPRMLAELPADQMTAFTHVSADGKLLCVPTTDARALEEVPGPGRESGENQVGGRRNEVIADKPSYDVDERVRSEGLSSWIRIFETESGRQVACERVPRAWVTHVQFCPTDSGLILYNHEWPSDCGIRRVWIWDGHSHRPLRCEGGGRSRRDWTCHEMWEPDGRFVIYHGKFADGTAYIGRVDGLRGGEPVELALPTGYRRYGHFTVGTIHPDWLVSDGYWHPAGQPEDGRFGGEWISVLKVDWASRRIEWSPLCRHQSLWDCQDSHPHPVFSPGDHHIYFTSNAGKGRSVCRVRTNTQTTDH